MTTTQAPARVLRHSWRILFALLHLRVSYATRLCLTDAQRAELHRRIDAQARECVE
jgi:hypothetical protein